MSKKKRTTRKPQAKATETPIPPWGVKFTPEGIMVDLCARPPMPECRFPVDDPFGRRVLVVPEGKYEKVSPAVTNFVLDVEARTGTRLKDGEEPFWFLKLHDDFVARRDPDSRISFADYCRRRHGDKIEVRKLQENIGDEGGAGAGGHATAEPECDHSDDFRVVRWFGVRYDFTARQAAVISILWDDFEAGGFGVTQAAIVELVGALTKRKGRFQLHRLFRNKGGHVEGYHEALGVMIVGDGRGRYRLQRCANGRAESEQAHHLRPASAHSGAPTPPYAVDHESDSGQVGDVGATGKTPAKVRRHDAVARRRS